MVLFKFLTPIVLLNNCMQFKFIPILLLFNGKPESLSLKKIRCDKKLISFHINKCSSYD